MCLMRATAGAMPFAAKLAGAAAARTALASFEQFYGWLRPGAADVDLWRTTYVHPHGRRRRHRRMGEGNGPAALRRSAGGRRTRGFLALYETAIADAYPRQADGKSLLRFPRLFIVATKI